MANRKETNGISFDRYGQRGDGDPMYWVSIPEYDEYIGVVFKDSKSPGWTAANKCHQKTVGFRTRQAAAEHLRDEHNSNHVNTPNIRPRKHA